MESPRLITSSSVEKVKSNKWKINIQFNNPKIKILNGYASSELIATNQIEILKIIFPYILNQFNYKNYTFKTGRSPAGYWIFRIFPCALNSDSNPLYSFNINKKQPITKTANKYLFSSDILLSVSQLCNIPHFAMKLDIQIDD